MSGIEHHLRIRDLVDQLILSRITILVCEMFGSGIAFPCDPLRREEEV